MTGATSPISITTSEAALLHCSSACAGWFAWLAVITLHVVYCWMCCSCHAQLVYKRLQSDVVSPLCHSTISSVVIPV